MSTASNSQTGGYVKESLGVGETASEMTTTGLFMPIQKDYKTMHQSFVKVDVKIAQVPLSIVLKSDRSLLYSGTTLRQTKMSGLTGIYQRLEFDSSTSPTLPGTIFYFLVAHICIALATTIPNPHHLTSYRWTLNSPSPIESAISRQDLPPCGGSTKLLATPFRGVICGDHSMFKR